MDGKETHRPDGLSGGRVGGWGLSRDEAEDESDLTREVK